ncbi:Fem-3 mRNA-binding factor 2 [Toxocara canis]|uniref:Fem-3 mRNA-binding factor 2 n=1 Tax=Toxocara canis TaxID=6265 RepID=A0A0B2VDT5_TOXCA|nr:Fem-3 mRNA-binding factor 2 [Toxocara canis]
MRIAVACGVSTFGYTQCHDLKNHQEMGSVCAQMTLLAAPQQQSARMLATLQHLGSNNSQLANSGVVLDYTVTAPQSQISSNDATHQINCGNENKENESSVVVDYIPKTPVASGSQVMVQNDVEELSEVVGDLVISESAFGYVTDLLSRGSGRLRRCLYESIFSLRVFSTACNNGHGHNVIMMLIDSSCAPPEQQLIANVLRGRMVELSLARFASRIIQRALQKLDIPTAGTLVAELRGIGRQLATHSYGSYVVEAVFTRMRPLNYGFIIDEMTESQEVTVEIMCSKYGCRVLESAIQVLVDDVENSQSSVADDFLRQLVKAVVDVCDIDIVTHEYGNFVVQKIISTQHLLDFADSIIKDVISENVLVLSQKKHGSHVIQTVLRCASPNSLYLIMREIFDGYDFDLGGKDALDILMLDVYGNYVVQTMLDVAAAVKEGRRDGLMEWFERLAGRIFRAKKTIINFSSGKKLIATLNEILHSSYYVMEFEKRSTGVENENGRIARCA